MIDKTKIITQTLILKWSKNTILLEQLQNPINKSQEEAKWILLRHIYMTS
jgi:hypothetical protein